MEEFEALIRDERAASAAKKALEAEHKLASEKLKQWFRDVGVRRAEVPGVAKVSISWVKGRKTYDIEAMRAAGIDVEAFTKLVKVTTVSRSRRRDPKTPTKSSD
jgi:NACalpha-BTF3-like transcription factor